MEFQKISLEIAVLFLIMLIGAFGGRRGYITEKISGDLNSVVLNVTNPCLIFCALQREFSAELLRNSFLLIVTSVLCYIVLMTISEIWGRRTKEEPSLNGTKRFLYVFGNTGYLGIPLLQVIFGSLGVFYVSMFSAVQNLLVFSYGYKIFGRKSEVPIWRQMMNNGMIATVVGLVFFLGQLQLPYILFQPMNLVGGLTVPLILLSVGSVISRVRLSELFRPAAMWWITLQKLILFPLISAGFFLLVPMPRDVAVVTVILISMPAALISGAITDANGGDVVLANKTVILSNLLVMFSIPGVIWMLEALGIY